MNRCSGPIKQMTNYGKNLSKMKNEKNQQQPNTNTHYYYVLWRCWSSAKTEKKKNLRLKIITKYTFYEYIKYPKKKNKIAKKKVSNSLYRVKENRIKYFCRLFFTSTIPL